MKRRNTFTKIAGSTYKCEVCGRGTRNTRVQGFSCKLCPQCFDLAGIENEISDGHVTADERRSQIGGLIAAIKSKGGDVTTWSETFGEDCPRNLRPGQPCCCPDCF